MALPPHIESARMDAAYLQSSVGDNLTIAFASLLRDKASYIDAITYLGKHLLNQVEVEKRERELAQAAEELDQKERKAVALQERVSSARKSLQSELLGVLAERAVLQAQKTASEPVSEASPAATSVEPSETPVADVTQTMPASSPTDSDPANAAQPTAATPDAIPE
ncbi:hypothetical protein M427DRAFT_70055 [Gonapodya prolifera JEL478]|uniref:Uncharacterized protein n=1 Tax=Gonapodya prolifera (strain JEL478) TaxID=1344416 RepID=A0A139AFX7_GONPJ|nr:hypothetical protein M427DRAFT_70055 [Gonapodya prolifera JEL478]|eukprot:KXS15464.1 hypothetical protein M427DRAFT_70055 [Gonapodya prolifera JEL478]